MHMYSLPHATVSWPAAMSPLTQPAAPPAECGAINATTEFLTCVVLALALSPRPFTKIPTSAGNEAQRPLAIANAGRRPDGSLSRLAMVIRQA